jgi:hypothetical protein
VFVCCFDIGTRRDSRFCDRPRTLHRSLDSNFHQSSETQFLFFIFIFLRLIVEGFFSLGTWCTLDSEDYAVEERDSVVDFSLEFLVMRIARTVIDCKSAEAKSLGPCIAQLPKIAEEEERA